jgi:hypothetical protein
MMARMFLGGSRKKAQAHFDKAVALMPGDVGVRFEYVKFLAIGDRKERARAVEEIEALQALTPFDAFDRLLQARAKAIGEALQADDKRAFKEAFGRATAFDAVDTSGDVPPYDLDRLP